jgi:beta-lactamase regulating signal transducer with metallopeptidase domain
VNVSTLLVLWLQSGFVLALALAACLVARRAPSLRLAIGRVSLLASIGLCLLLPWLGSRATPVVPIEWSPSAVTAVAKPPTKATPTPVPTVENITSSAAPESTFVSPPTPADPLPWVVGIWALGATLLSIHLGLGYGALARIRRSARRVTDPQAQSLLQEAAKDAQVKLPWLLESENVGSPFVAGALRPAVYLPKNWATSVDPETLRAVLSHEVAHIANGDLRWSLFHRVLNIALWPQPLLWLLKRPMIAASEELCDQQVVNAGIPSERYADCLLNLRDSLRGNPAPALGIGAFTTCSLLGKRIEALLDARRSRAVRLSRRTALMTRIGAVGIAIGASLIFASPISQHGASDDPYAGWMRSSYDVNVRILDKSGEPLAGDFQAYLLAQGDEDRRPVISDLKVDKNVVVVNAGSGSGSHAGALVVRSSKYGLQFVRLWPSPKPVQEIRLSPSTTIKGRLILPDGQPAAGLSLRVALLIQGERGDVTFANLSGADVRHGIQAVTDAQGGFELEGLPPKTNVQLMVPDPRFAMLSMDQRPTTPDKGVSPLFEIKLQAGAYLSGRVARNGLPVAGVRVGAQENHDLGPSSRGDWAEAVTDSQGRYTLYGLGPVPYNVALELKGQLAQEVNAPAHVGIVGKPGETIEGLDFDLKPGAVIEGFVYDKNSKPFPNTMVGVYGPAHPNSSAWVQSAKTDGSGFYRLRVPPGKQHVYWMDGQGGKSEYLTVADGSITKHDIRLDEQTVPNDRTVVAERETLDLANAPQAKETAAFGPGAPNYGPFRLKNGAVVRLAYVQDDAFGEHTVWNPDGSPASAADKARSLNMVGFATNHRQGRAVFLRVEVDGLARGDYYCHAEVPHKSDWTVWQTYGEGGDSNRAMDMASFRAPEELGKTDLRFGVAGGPEKPFATWKPGEPVGTMKIGEPPRDWGATGGPAPEFSVTIEVPKSLDKALLNMRVYGKDGKELQRMIISDRSDIDERTGKRTRNFVFTGGQPSEISRIEVGVQEFEWVTFKGIKLYPNR